MNDAELSVKQVNRMTQLRNHAAFDHMLATGTVAKTGSLGSDGNIPKLGSYGPHFGRAQALMQIGKNRQQVRFRHRTIVEAHDSAHGLLIFPTLFFHKWAKHLGNTCEAVIHPLGSKDRGLTTMTDNLTQVNNKLLVVT